MGYLEPQGKAFEMSHTGSVQQRCCGHQELGRLTLLSQSASWFSGIHLLLGLSTKLQDAHAYVIFWGQGSAKNELWSKLFRGVYLWVLAVQAGCRIYNP